MAGAAETSAAAPNAQPAKPTFELSASRQFVQWLAERKASLAFTTYQAGKVFFIGLKPDGKLSIFERTLARCMGMTAAGNSLYISTLYQIWRFENALPPGQTNDGYDRVYVPQLSYVTGDLDIHDMALDRGGRLVFVNTLFGCLATVTETDSFRPLWQPKFLSKLAAEDRCHLNGLAMRDGDPAFVTAVAESDVADGWREHRRSGGVVIDVGSNEIVLRGLSMPHSPRWYRGRLWLHNSGTGEFGTVDLKAGRFEPVCFCPGYLRGLAFLGDFAVAGLSKPRENRTFSGLALDEGLAKRNAAPRCGLQVIDLRSGDIVQWVRLEGVVHELYDVVPLDAVRPMAIGFQSDEIRRVIKVGEPAPLRPPAP
jgi:uncharacterized protein (TIGR03032 family)